MSGIVGFLAILLFSSTVVSIVVDLITYTLRQDDWERGHPGQVYVRNYRELVK